MLYSSVSSKLRYSHYVQDIAKQTVYSDIDRTEGMGKHDSCYEPNEYGRYSGYHRDSRISCRILCSSVYLNQSIYPQFLNHTDRCLIFQMSIYHRISYQKPSQAFLSLPFHHAQAPYHSGTAPLYQVKILSCLRMK